MDKVKLIADIVEKMCSLSESIRGLAELLMQEAQDDRSEEPQPEEVKPARKVEFSELRALLARKSHEGYTAEIRELLKKYGAAKLSDIKEENYVALFDEAEVLKHASN